MPRWRRLAAMVLPAAALVGLAVWGFLGLIHRNTPAHPAVSIDPKVVRSHVSRTAAGMVRFPAGRFEMGSNDEDLPATHPVHAVHLKTYQIDTHAVTNRQFTAFIAASHYVTTAEQVGHSRVFDRQAKEWRDIREANWLHPNGPDSSVAGRDNFPVVHVSWFDAMAYSKWAGKRLATEAEYEYAARAGRSDTIFPWGLKEWPDGRRMANYWQGRFPFVDLGRDGFRGIAPVGSFPPNQVGLVDMAGNTWCWCRDWYAADYYYSSPGRNPTGPKQGSERVLRGGSWLSARNFRFGIRTAARWHAPPQYSSNDVGFRCVAD